MSMTRFVLLGAFALSGCAGLATVNPGQVSSAAAGLFGIPAATVSAQVVQELVEIQAVAAQLQMLKAQLDGTPVALPSIPSPVVVNPRSEEHTSELQSRGHLVFRLLL